MRDMHEAEVWTNLTDAFTGHLLSRDGEVFAFQCSPIIDGRLWHWVLLPVSSSSVMVETQRSTFTRLLVPGGRKRRRLISGTRRLAQVDSSARRDGARAVARW